MRDSIFEKRSRRRFPIDELLIEEECYQSLKRSFHPESLFRPNGHALPVDQAPPDRRRAPIVGHRCQEWGAAFNIFADTARSKMHSDCSTIVMLLRRFANGILTEQLTDDMVLASPSVLKCRHRAQEAVQAGKRAGVSRALREGAPQKLLGGLSMTCENDRSRVTQMVGRTTTRAFFEVCPDTKEETIQAVITEETTKEACIFTDENRSYLGLENEEESREVTTRSSIHSGKRHAFKASQYPQSPAV